MKILKSFAYANAVAASLMGIATFTIHNILIGIAFAVIARALAGEDKSVKEL